MMLNMLCSKIAKTVNNISAVKKDGHYSVEKNERVTLEQPTDDEIKNLLDINPNKVLEGVEANLLTKDEAENYIK